MLVPAYLRSDIPPPSPSAVSAGALTPPPFNGQIFVTLAPGVAGALLAALLVATACRVAQLGLVCGGALSLAAGAVVLMAASLSAAVGFAAQTRTLTALTTAARIGRWHWPVGAATAEWSPCLQRLLGVAGPPPDEASQLAAFHPDDRPALQALSRRVTTTLRPEGLDVRILHPRLGLRHVRWEALAETDPQGRVVALWGYAQDITERRAAEDRQRQASRMDALGQMAAGLAHDFNNLLCTVVLNLDMLTESHARGSDLRVTELARRARAAAERGADLTGQLLAFAGMRPMQCQHLDLPQAVRASLAALAPAPGVKLTLSSQHNSGDRPMLVQADPAQLRAAVQALLAHAQQAVAKGARASGAARSPAGDVLVLLTLAETVLDRDRAAALGIAPGRYAEIAVHDDTEAPAPDLLPRLLEPFFRARADGTDPNGTGVHLALAHGVARGHGGCLTVEGRPGEGTTARLLLPLLAEPRPATEAEPIPAQARPDRSLSGLRVLLVEDDPAVREATEALLHEIGATVTTADDGAAALALLHGALPFDLLLSDVVLPGWLSGIDVVEAAATLRPGLPALLASGYAAPAQELGRALPAGVHLLHKPYRRADLLDAVVATLPASRSHAVA